MSRALNVSVKWFRYNYASMLLFIAVPHKTFLKLNSTACKKPRWTCIIDSSWWKLHAYSWTPTN